MATTRHETGDGVVRLEVVGEVDLAAADDLYDLIMHAAGTGHPADIVVDLANVRFCDSSGIGALVRGRNDAARHGSTVTVVRPRGMVHRALTVSGVWDMLVRDG
jgi:anti-anti-sigma factor